MTRTHNLNGTSVNGISLGGESLVVYYKRCKHIMVNYHFIRDMIARGAFRIEKVPTKLNHSDMGTKILPVNKFNICKNLFNIGID